MKNQEHIKTQAGRFAASDLRDTKQFLREEKLSLEEKLLFLETYIDAANEIFNEYILSLKDVRY